MEWISRMRSELNSDSKIGSVVLFGEYLNDLQECLHSNDLPKLVHAKLMLNGKIRGRFPHRQMVCTMVEIEDVTMFVLDLIMTNTDQELDCNIRLDWSFALPDFRRPLYLNEYGVRDALLSHSG